MALLHRPGGRRPADHRPGLPGRVRALAGRGLISTPAGRILLDRRAVSRPPESRLDASCHVSTPRPGGRRRRPLPPSPAWSRPARGRPSTTSPTQRHVLGLPGRRAAARRHRSDPRHAGRRRAEPRLQHDDQRLRRHQGLGLDHARAALQRRADARLRADASTASTASRRRRRSPLGGVEISRSVLRQEGHRRSGRRAGRAGWTRSRNTTGAPITVKVAFGGQTGYSAVRRATRARWSTPSSGDATVTAADAWAEVATPLSGTTLVGGPQATVIGTPAPFGGAMTFTGNWLLRHVQQPARLRRPRGQLPGLRQHARRCPPGATKSLLHYVVLGQRVTTATSAAERAEGRGHGGDARRHAGARPTSAPPQICSIDNFTDRRAPAPASARSRAIAGARAAPKPVTTVRLRRGREDDRPDARRHGVRPDDLAGDHARLPGPDRGLRPGPVRLQRLRDRRHRRDGAGARPPTRRARRARSRPSSASRSRSRTSTTPRTWRPPTAA